MPAQVDSLDQCIADLRPYFARQGLVYVDVGAHKGKVFESLCGSGLNVGEAHLFEPNPESFKILEVTARGAFRGRSLNLHQVAVGEQPGTVRMRPADTMTKVVGDAKAESEEGDGDANVFSVECLTLDVCRQQFTDERVSLLKIDVEGFEAQVLRGAAELLGNQNVDVVYLEAGLNPRGTQQTYYRTIDDLMLGYGYRIFRIYEQKHEWMEDSPFLRRMNVAYFSQRFADRHPYKLTHELYQEQLRLAGAKAASKPASAVARPTSPPSKPAPAPVLDDHVEKKLRAELEAERLRYADERGRLEARARFFEELYRERQEELEHLRRQLDTKRD